MTSKKVHGGHKEVKFKSDVNYIISIRNPICRWVSAFNWRYYKIVDARKKGGQEGENKFLQIWKTPNNLAENLYDELGNCNFKHDIPGTHIERGISVYLKGLRSDTKVLGVIMQETLAEDMKSLFNITVVEQKHSNYSSGYSTFLSSKAKDNLHKYLDSDFKSLKKLKDMDLLTQNQIRQYEHDYKC